MPGLKRTHSSSQWVDGAEEGGLADGRHDPDDQREREEGGGAVDELQEAEQNVGGAGQEGTVQEEAPRPDGVDKLAEDGGEDDGGDEN